MSIQGSSFFSSIGYDAVEGKEFTILPAKQVDVVGSYLLRSTVVFDETEGALVDIAVEMEHAMFQEKDYLDHRYHCKRALFLQAVVEHLHGLDIVEPSQTRFEAFLDDLRKPVAVVVPKSKFAFGIRILPTIPKVWNKRIKENSF